MHEKDLATRVYSRAWILPAYPIHGKIVNRERQGDIRPCRQAEGGVPVTSADGVRGDVASLVASGDDDASAARQRTSSTDELRRTISGLRNTKSRALEA